MSESPAYSWPCHENANTHPAGVILNAKQKCQSPAQKAATDKDKAAQDQESVMKAQKNCHTAVAQVTQLKDTICQEDKAYPIIASERMLRYSRNVHPTWVKFESNNTKESEWSERF